MFWVLELQTCCRAATAHLSLTARMALMGRCTIWSQSQMCLKGFVVVVSFGFRSGPENGKSLFPFKPSKKGALSREPRSWVLFWKLCRGHDPQPGFHTRWARQVITCGRGPTQFPSFLILKKQQFCRWTKSAVGICGVSSRIPSGGCQSAWISFEPSSSLQKEIYLMNLDWPWTDVRVLFYLLF